MGTAKLDLALLDGTSSSSKALSRASTTVQIAPNVTNTFALTANPVVDHASVTLGSTSLPAGTATSVPVTVNAYDADNNLIVGAAPFVTPSGAPLTLSLAASTTGGGNGTVTFSSTQVTNAAQVVSATYNGAAITKATVTIVPSAPIQSLGPASSLSFVPTIVAEYPFPTSGAGDTITSLVAGPDGNLWGCGFVNGVITKTTPSGMTVSYPFAPGNPNYIVVGPDGALWATAFTGSVSRITTAGSITTFSVPSGSGLTGIAAGRDGNLWYVQAVDPGIGRLTPSGVATTFSTLTSNAYIEGIAAGSDGALWFTERSANNIGRVSTSGVVTEYPLPTPNAVPFDIAAGPDGAMWFTEANTAQIGRITTAGVITEFPVAGANGLLGIVTAPDGGLWFTDRYNSKIGRMATDGSYVEYPTPTAGRSPYRIAVGPDGNLWFGETGVNQLGKLVY